MLKFLQVRTLEFFPYIHNSACTIMFMMASKQRARLSGGRKRPNYIVKGVRNAGNAARRPWYVCMDDGTLLLATPDLMH